jgi:hypothetical protein
MLVDPVGGSVERLVVRPDLVVCGGAVVAHCVLGDVGCVQGGTLSPTTFISRPALAPHRRQIFGFLPIVLVSSSIQVCISPPILIYMPHPLQPYPYQPIAASRSTHPTSILNTSSITITDRDRARDPACSCSSYSATYVTSGLAFILREPPLAL